MDDALRRALAEADAMYAASQVPDDGEARRRQRRRLAIAALSGRLTGVYEPGYLDDLRRDWPE